MASICAGCRFPSASAICIGSAARRGCPICTRSRRIPTARSCSTIAKSSALKVSYPSIYPRTMPAGQTGIGQNRSAQIGQARDDIGAQKLPSWRGVRRANEKLGKAGKSGPFLAQIAYGPELELKRLESLAMPTAAKKAAVVTANPTDAVSRLANVTDRMHGLLMDRADALMGCTENSPEVAELVALTDVIEAYERQRWPLGRTPGSNG